MKKLMSEEAYKYYLFICEKQREHPGEPIDVSSLIPEEVPAEDKQAYADKLFAEVEDAVNLRNPGVVKLSAQARDSFESMVKSYRQHLASKPPPSCRATYDVTRLLFSDRILPGERSSFLKCVLRQFEIERCIVDLREDISAGLVNKDKLSEELLAAIGEDTTAGQSEQSAGCSAE